MDVFEQVPSLCINKVNVYTILFTLIKIRLIQDLHDLRNASLLLTGLPILRTGLPKEISDIIRRNLMPNIPKHRHRELLDGRDPQPLIWRLEKQILELIESKKRDHPLGWDILIQLGRQNSMVLSSPQEKPMQAAMQWSFDAWMESKCEFLKHIACFLLTLTLPSKPLELSISLPTCSIANRKVLDSLGLPYKLQLS